MFSSTHAIQKIRFVERKEKILWDIPMTFKMYFNFGRILNECPIKNHIDIKTASECFLCEMKLS